MGQTVANIHKRIFLGPNINKSCLHPRQDILNLPFIDVADQMRVGRTFHLDGFEYPVLHQRHPCLLWHNCN